MSQHDRPDHSAPIPPYQGARDQAGSTSEPRYLKTEPLPPRSPFEQMMGAHPGMRGPGITGPGGMPVTLPRKSLLLATVLAALLGPLGMLYSTILGAFVMTGVWFWTLFLATGMVPVVWIWGMLWALWAAHRKNERRRMVEAHFAQR